MNQAANHFQSMEIFSCKHDLITQHKIKMILLSVCAPCLKQIVGFFKLSSAGSLLLFYLF